MSHQAEYAHLLVGLGKARDVSSDWVCSLTSRAWKGPRCLIRLSMLTYLQVLERSAMSNQRFSVWWNSSLLNYIHRQTHNVHDVRLTLFHQGKTLDRLPPTKDTQRVGRVNYQSQVWHCSLKCNPQLPLPNTCRRKLEKNSYIPIMTTGNAIPPEYLKITCCRCKMQCKAAACSCRQDNVSCNSGYPCYQSACFNPHTAFVDSPNNDSEIDSSDDEETS